MPLTSNDQLAVLYDLLSEQFEDCCGSVSELQQIQRLAQSLLANQHITDQEMNQLFSEIIHYGKQGEGVQDINQHITDFQSQLSTWTNSIQSYNTY